MFSEDRGLPMFQIPPGLFSGLAYEEKARGVKIIEEICEVANIARAQGILALEKEIGKHPLILDELLSMIVDGQDPLLIRQFLTNYFSSLETGSEAMFEAMLYGQGALMLQTGQNPNMMAHMLLGFMGENIGALGKSYYEEQARIRREMAEMHDAFMVEAGAVRKQGMEESQQIRLHGFYSMIALMAESHVAKEDFAMILLSLHKEIQGQIIASMPQRRGEELIQTMKTLEAQKRYTPEAAEEAKKRAMAALDKAFTDDEGSFHVAYSTKVRCQEADENQ